MADCNGQRALVAGVGSFTRGWDRLPFAVERATEVGDALSGLGVEGRVLADPTLGELEGALGQALRDAGTGGSLVVHLLSHGFQGRTGALYVVAGGSDEAADNRFDVETWLRKEVEDAPGSPQVLMLLDNCHAGAALDAGWRLRLGERRKTWVLAATRAGEDAYSGRFSQAVAVVLRDLRASGLGVDPSQEWVSISLLAKRIQLELADHCRRENALPQDVVADLVDPVREPAPRFFRNPRYSPEARGRFLMVREQALRSFLADLDTVLDPAHYLGRALGRMDQADLVGGCCFSGRERELVSLARWLDGDAAGAVGLRVVTGGPGAGKSALLGVLVCAAHPDLAEAARTVRDRVPDRCLPGRNDQLAAVHARGRRLDEVVASLARQLGLEPPDTAAALVEAIGQRAKPPVIVVDALDEAGNPKDLQDLLLLPLAGAGGCRLLVGTRPWPEFTPLLRAAGEGLVDLDRVSPAQLERDLAGYVQRLLGTSRLYGRAGQRALREDVASTIAGVLAGGRVEGAFLVAVLYAHHLLSLAGPVEDLALVREQVPLDPGAMIELHLTHLPPDPWLRPMLAGMAHAKDQGMPARLLAAVACAFRAGASGGPSAEQVDAVLDAVRFYLRRAVDRDGTTLYRLFHQGLADYLRQHPLSAQDATPIPAERILDHLLPPRWDLAEPYLLRHAIHHAADAAKTDDLIADPEFLVHADRATLLPELWNAQTETARRHAMVYRTTAAYHEAVDPEGRRQLLSLDALRHGVAPLAEQLATPHGMPSPHLPWTPLWATGSRTNPALLATLTGHVEGVTAVAIGALDGRVIAVSAGGDSTVRVWDLAAGRPVGPPLISGGIYAVAFGTVGGHAVAVSGGWDGAVRIWDLATGQLLGEPLTGHAHWVYAAAVGMMGGRVVAVSGGEDQTVRVWDLATRKPVGKPLTGHTDPIFAVAVGTVAGRAVAVSGGRDGAVRVWDLAMGQPVGEPLTDDTGSVFAVAVGTVGGRVVAVSGSEDGTVQVWDLATRKPVGKPLTNHTDRVAGVAVGTVAGRAVAVSGSWDHTVRVWDLASSQPVGQPLTGHIDVVEAVALGRVAGRAVAVSGGRDGTVRVWDLAAGQPAGPTLTGHTDRVGAVAVGTLHGRAIAVSKSGSAMVQVWDLATGQPLGRPLTSHTDRIAGVVLGTAGGHIVAVSMDRDDTVQVWDLSTGLSLGPPLTGHTDTVYAVAVGTLGGRTVVVSGDRDGAVRVWDVASGQPVGQPLTGHTFQVTTVAVGAVGGRAVAVSGGRDGTVWVWDLTMGQHVGRSLTGHTDSVDAVAVGALGGRAVVVSGSLDHTVRVWDLSTGHLLDTFTFPYAVWALALAPNGHLVVGFGWEVAVLRWTGGGLRGA